MLAACPAKAPPTQARAEQPIEDRDVVEVASASLVRDGCERAASDGGAVDVIAVPTWREPSGPERSTSEAFDVVMYTAHPDDEAMYAGGTMDRLVRAGQRVAFVALSHGEGGRLLERALDGGVEERRDYPRSRVVAVRDREVAEAARRIGVAFAHLHPAEANVDDAWTTSCEETLSRWNKTLPGGVAGVLHRLVADVRARRPRVVIALDPRDDPQASHHGHHKAAGVLTDAAVRLASDPRVRGAGEPHVVEELLTTAPRGLQAGVTVPVRVPARISMLSAYGSQFVPEQLATDAVAQRPNEEFVLRWRAVQAPPAKDGARLLELVRSAPEGR